ncbi:MAG TPA: glycine cleavage system aminomethyltransferase GcvT, partial [bacterium]|nr:glycine cleavage system aminomethyltransferase GcvT [bacterium]
MTIQHLPLASRHAQNQAKLGHFGSWEVPLYYRGILEEHEAVRAAAGLFDISHMGKFFVSGSNAPEFLDGLLPRSISKMSEGQAIYMPLLNEQAGILDDILVYRFSRYNYCLIVNAGNTEKDSQWIRSFVPFSGVEL